MCCSPVVSLKNREELMPSAGVSPQTEYKIGLNEYEDQAETCDGLQAICNLALPKPQTSIILTNDVS